MRDEATFLLDPADIFLYEEWTDFVACVVSVLCLDI